MLATEETNRRDGDASLRAWADQRIQMHNGVGVEIGRTPGPRFMGIGGDPSIFRPVGAGAARTVAAYRAGSLAARTNIIWCGAFVPSTIPMPTNTKALCAI